MPGHCGIEVEVGSMMNFLDGFIFKVDVDFLVRVAQGFWEQVIKNFGGR